MLFVTRRISRHLQNSTEEMFIKQTSELDEHGKSASITIKRLFIGSETDSLIFPLEVFHRSDIIYDTTLANPFALIINLPSSAIVKILF